ncbi:MAG: DegT/DnrJ/EryC1/StrS aminotransferase family protein [Candidatus Poribacteria bacterium]
MIPVAEPSLDGRELKYVTEALKSGWVSSKGKFIELFEQNFAAYCGRKFGVCTSNGTVSLHLALLSLGIGKGDEVIVPSFTFVASVNAITYTGAKPVFVDSNPVYWGMDPDKIDSAITSRTRAIMIVHLYGHPCDIQPIVSIAKKRGLYVIEDAAEAHGACYRGRKIGSFGAISSFSFFGNKTITTGEGGMCLTDNESLYKKMRVLRDHGMNPKRRYWYDVVGYNYRMTNLQAALGMGQFEQLDKFIEKKRKIAEWYSSGLMDLHEKGVIQLHPEMGWARCSYWMYSLVINPRRAGICRDDLIKQLLDVGVESRPFFYPVHILPPYRKNKPPFPVAEKLGKNGINLPSSVKLSHDQVKKICSVIRKTITNKSKS